MMKALEYLHDFFDWIMQMFKTLGQVIVRLVSILGKCLEYLKNVLSVVPTWMYVILVVLAVVCILYKVLGREGNA